MLKEFPNHGETLGLSFNDLRECEYSLQLEKTERERERERVDQELKLISIANPHELIKNNM